MGHPYGPFSAEVTDCLLQIDEDLGELFAWLDQHVGQDRWVLAMTADHGVLPLPEGNPRLQGGATAGRVTSDQIKAFNRAISEALKAEFGEDSKGRGLRTHLAGGHVYFDHKDLANRKIDAVAARKLVAQVAREQGWVAAAYPLEALAGSDTPTDPHIEHLRNCFDARYAADVTLVQREGQLLGLEDGNHPRIPLHLRSARPLVLHGTAV